MKHTNLGQRITLTIAIAIYSAVLGWPAIAQLGEGGLSGSRDAWTLDGLDSSEFAVLAAANDFTGGDLTVSGGDITTNYTNDSGAVQVLVDNDSTNAAASARLQVSADDTHVALFSSGSNRSAALITNGLIGNVATLRTLGADSIEFGTSNTLRAYFSPSSSLLNLVGAAVGDSSTAQLTFLDSGLTQIGYVGDASSGNSDLLFYNSIAGAGVRITEGGEIHGGSSAGVDMTPITGTFTATFDEACTTSPAITVYYYKIGDAVTLSTGGTISCTSDTTIWTASGDVPAALRPAASVYAGVVLAADLADPTVIGQVLVESDGDLTYRKCTAIDVSGGTGTFGEACAGSWSNSSTRRAAAWSGSYVLN